MKKLFVSVPMRGRTDENISKSIAVMHRAAEVLLGEKLEVIDSYEKDAPPSGNERVRLYYLGRAVSKMASADYVVGAGYIYNYSGCYIEKTIADEYKIPYIMLPADLVCPDLDLGGNAHDEVY